MDVYLDDLASRMLLSRRFLCFLSLIFVSYLYPVSALPASIKTPTHLESIFIARCLEYQEVVRPELFQKAPKNCTYLWRLFSSSFAYKDPCNVDPEAYSQFIREADHYVDTKNKVMYWSGDVYPFVIEYARYTKRYTTIRDQLAVYALDAMEHWCGQVSHPGINYDECPAWGMKDCQKSATSSFWKEMSKHFASKVQGMVHVMLNASSPQPYRRNGIFVQSELSRLKKEVTPELHVHLVSLLDVPPVESCSNGTLLQLREDVAKKGMNFLCSEKEPNIMYLQCVRTPEAENCKQFRIAFGSASPPSTVSLSAILLLWLIQMFTGGETPVRLMVSEVAES